MSQLPAPAAQVHMFTDGACSGNPGPGGWGCIIRAGGYEKELSGGAPHTTNNRMEISAVTNGLKALTRPCTVTVHTDSQYVMKGFTEWMPGWLHRNWRNSHGKPVENRDLWEELAEAATPHTLKWKWIRGHAGHPENERADALAVAAIPRR